MTKAIERCSVDAVEMMSENVAQNFEIIAHSQEIHLFYWLIQAILVELIL